MDRCALVAISVGVAAASLVPAARAGRPVVFDVDGALTHITACASILELPELPAAPIRIFLGGEATVEFDERAPIPFNGESPVTFPAFAIDGVQDHPELLVFDDFRIERLGDEPIEGYVAGRADAADPDVLVATVLNLQVTTAFSIQIAIPPFPPIVIGPVDLEIPLGDFLPLPNLGGILSAQGGGNCTLDAPCLWESYGAKAPPSFETLELLCAADSLCDNVPVCYALEVPIPIGEDTLTFVLDLAGQFVASTATNLDATASMVLHDPATGVYEMGLLSGAMVQSVNAGPLLPDWVFLGAGDFDRDGDTDALFRDTDTRGVCAEGDGTGLGIAFLEGNVGVDFRYIGCLPEGHVFEGNADIDQDGNQDLVFRVLPAAEFRVWLLDENVVVADRLLTGNVPASFVVEGFGDFDGNGVTDPLVRNAAIDAVYALLLGPNLLPLGTPEERDYFLDFLGPDEKVLGVGDLDRDGGADVAILNDRNEVFAWLVDGGDVRASDFVVGLDDPIFGLGDFNGDGQAEILFIDDLPAGRIGPTVIYLDETGTAAEKAYTLAPVPGSYEILAIAR